MLERVRQGPLMPKVWRCWPTHTSPKGLAKLKFGLQLRLAIDILQTCVKSSQTREAGVKCSMAHASDLMICRARLNGDSKTHIFPYKYPTTPIWGGFSSWSLANRREKRFKAQLGDFKDLTFCESWGHLFVFDYCWELSNPQLLQDHQYPSVRLLDLKGTSFDRYIVPFGHFHVENLRYRLSSSPRF